MSYIYSMIKKTKKVADPIQDIFEVVQNYKKRGHHTILLTIQQIEDVLDAAGYRADDPLMIDYTTSHKRITTQENFDKNKKNITKKCR